MQLKTRVENPKDPLQFFLPNDEGKMIPQEVWACGECRMLTIGHHKKEDALNHCKIQRCKDCKTEIKVEYKCEQCFDCASLERRRKIVYKDVEYVKGPLCELDGDRYFSDMDDLLDHYANEDPDERPEYFHPCDENTWSGLHAGNTIADALENASQDLFEDAADQMSETVEIEKAIDEWNKKQNIKYWTARQDERIKIDYSELNN